VFLLHLRHGYKLGLRHGGARSSSLLLGNNFLSFTTIWSSYLYGIHSLCLITKIDFERIDLIKLIIINKSELKAGHV